MPRIEPDSIAELEEELLTSLPVINRRTGRTYSPDLATFCDDIASQPLTHLDQEVHELAILTLQENGLYAREYHTGLQKPIHQWGTYVAGMNKSDNHAHPSIIVSSVNRIDDGIIQPGEIELGDILAYRTIENYTHRTSKS